MRRHASLWVLVLLGWKRHLTCEMPASPTMTPATMVHAFSVSLFQANSVRCADARWVPPARQSCSDGLTQDRQSFCVGPPIKVCNKT